MTEIVKVHYPDIESTLLAQALTRFYQLREMDDLRKKPSTSELIDWVLALRRAGIHPDILEQELPFLGALIKTESMWYGDQLVTDGVVRPCYFSTFR